ncbi:MAG: hypothetical protein HOK57_02435 [Planctomycetaceae bacterium]|nr:hypothetical protein [Planctomycetaceae bacterium]MBT6055176.1 hypothetical protein [Planctomycetaceae bacterium]MBT6458661.1 hypothetical protein [Planctomycetaceae bacterium]MBT7729787.1 hypothetical protein [Planctomycetaceae bacterium]
MPYLSGITIYPVKSLDGMSLLESAVVPCGALLHDRRWRLVDAEGRVVNAKKFARIHTIRARFEITNNDLNGAGKPSPAGGLITLWLGSKSGGPSSTTQPRETFPLIPGSEGPCEWLSDALGKHVFLEERLEGGFPDDLDAPGPTLISTETLNEVARWFGWGDEEVRRRFRMNLELTDDAHQVSSGGGSEPQVLQQPFWEDSLACPVQKDSMSPVSEGEDSLDYLPVVEPKVFFIGEIVFRAVGVCRRCVVPSRDTQNGKQTRLFRDAFEARRFRGLRHDVDVREWQDYYRLGLNTSVLQSSPYDQIAIGQQFKFKEPN